MVKEDEVLIKEFIDGNQGSFKFLVEKYTPSIYNFAVHFVGKLNAPDMVQDIFVKVWKNIKKFNSEKSTFKTWVFIIARNTIIDNLRKKKMIVFSSLDTEEESFESNIQDEIILPDEALSKLEDKNLLNLLLDELPTNYKEVIILYYQEEMTFIEIGKLLGKPHNTVKSYHHRALILLRKLLEERK